MALQVLSEQFLTVRLVSAVEAQVTLIRLVCVVVRVVLLVTNMMIMCLTPGPLLQQSGPVLRTVRRL